MDFQSALETFAEAWVVAANTGKLGLPSAFGGSSSGYTSPGELKNNPDLILGKGNAGGAAATPGSSSLASTSSISSVSGLFTTTITNSVSNTLVGSPASSENIGLDYTRIQSTTGSPTVPSSSLIVSSEMDLSPASRNPKVQSNRKINLPLHSHEAGTVGMHFNDLDPAFTLQNVSHHSSSDKKNDGGGKGDDASEKNLSKWPIPQATSGKNEAARCNEIKNGGSSGDQIKPTSDGCLNDPSDELIIDEKAAFKNEPKVGKTKKFCAPLLPTKTGRVAAKCPKRKRTSSSDSLCINGNSRMSLHDEHEVGSQYSTVTLDGQSQGKSIPIHCVIEARADSSKGESSGNLGSGKTGVTIFGHTTASEITSSPGSSTFKDGNTKTIVEVDDFVILPVSTLFHEVVPTILSMLGYPKDIIQQAQGTIALRNWKPLRLDQVCDSPRKTVGDILQDLTNHAVLHILVTKGKGGNSEDLKEKLLRILLGQSSALLLGSGCPLDEETFSQILKGHWPQTVPEDMKRRFDQWFASHNQRLSGLLDSLHPPNHHSTHSLLNQQHSSSRQLDGGTGTSISHVRNRHAHGILNGGGNSGHSTHPHLQPPHHDVPHNKSSYDDEGSNHPVFHGLTTHKTRMRTSFDPEMELPKLQKWFNENPHPSRHQIQQYVRELNELECRKDRKPLDVNNVIYWFKNARAAQKRNEMRFNGLLPHYSHGRDSHLMSQTPSHHSHSHSHHHHIHHHDRSGVRGLHGLIQPASDSGDSRDGEYKGEGGEPLNQSLSSSSHSNNNNHHRRDSNNDNNNNTSNSNVNGGSNANGNSNHNSDSSNQVENELSDDNEDEGDQMNSISSCKDDGDEVMEGGIKDGIKVEQEKQNYDDDDNSIVIKEEQLEDVEPQCRVEGKKGKEEEFISVDVDRSEGRELVNNNEPKDLRSNHSDSEKEEARSDGKRKRSGSECHDTPDLRSSKGDEGGSTNNSCCTSLSPRSSPGAMSPPPDYDYLAGHSSLMSRFHPILDNPTLVAYHRHFSPFGTFAQNLSSPNSHEASGYESTLSALSHKSMLPVTKPNQAFNFLQNFTNNMALMSPKEHGKNDGTVSATCSSSSLSSPSVPPDSISRMRGEDLFSSRPASSVDFISSIINSGRGEMALGAMNLGAHPHHHPGNPVGLDERRKRNRTFIDPVTEVPRLEQWFSLNTHPSHNLILKYTDELNRMPYRQKFPKLEPKNVQFWFKNRRAKCKRLKMTL